jgi:hypothetical protein
MKVKVQKNSKNILENLGEISFGMLFQCVPASGQENQLFGLPQLLHISVPFLVFL